jgi:hypothetical protein
MFKLGTVINFFEKTGVCVVELIQDIDINFKLKAMHEYKDTTDISIEFIQIGSKKTDFATKDQIVIIKFDKALRKGTEIYKNG